MDDAWRAEIAQIYRNYELYHQSQGDEQPIFSGQSTGPQPRSALIIDYLDGALTLREDARVLDFGCGTGSALKTFSGRHPRWHLYGAEIRDDARERLAQLPNFVELYTCDLDAIDARFDLVTLIHSLEHIISPVDTLIELRRLIGDDGRVFVQVPDCAITPFDFVIVDHLTHFTVESLRRLGERAGYETVAAHDALLPKELSWIGKAVASRDRPAETPQKGLDEIRAQVDWLNAQVRNSRELARSSANFGIFGTSISGTWLAGAVDDEVDFFVDEDPQRIGREHMGRPIIAPDNVAENSDVFIPLIPKVAAAVKSRLARQGVRYHAPADIVR
ncbi:class I SAM-dependent methyltransferase [Methylocystis sp.]|uniref:class I SAM-dependent methyltransferase n=1 Tax=Methylocystis sp. TaxID=1911079 RepID=UPI003DA34279